MKSEESNCEHERNEKVGNVIQLYAILLEEARHFDRLYLSTVATVGPALVLLGGFGFYFLRADTSLNVDGNVLRRFIAFGGAICLLLFSWLISQYINLLDSLREAASKVEDHLNTHGGSDSQGNPMNVSTPEFGVVKIINRERQLWLTAPFRGRRGVLVLACTTIVGWVILWLVVLH